MTRLEEYAGARYNELREAHPHFAGYLDLMIVVRPVFGGGYDVIGEIYPDRESAIEAQKAAIMIELLRITGESR